MANLNLEICDCICHTSGNFHHMNPCCSVCPHCNENIRVEFFNEHVENCTENFNPSALETCNSKDENENISA
jgi:hypothetical protein